MIQIQPVVFPLNLGTANQINITISSNIDGFGSVIYYHLFDGSSLPPKRLSNGTIKLSEENFIAHGNDKDWIINHTAKELGVTLI